ncbi:MAG: HD domain-containing protein [Aureliella sp.]
MVASGFDKSPQEADAETKADLHFKCVFRLSKLPLRRSVQIMPATLTNLRQKDLIPLSSASLITDEWPDVDVYLCSSSDAVPVLFFAGSETAARGRLPKLDPSLSEKLFIDQSDSTKYQEYLEANWRDIVARDDLPPVGRVGVMSDVMRQVLSSEFARGDVAKIMSASKELGASTCEVIADSPLAVCQLLSVLHHDYGTFTHSTNVAIFAVLLARQLGYSGTDLDNIAVGGLVHDLGKLRIASSILNKPGRLSDEEFRIVQEHPTVGYRELCKQPDISFDQLMMVYQHHEKMNGSGYPVGCSGDEIHDWAKICTVVDVYEALTSNRPYRKPASRDTALAILNNGDGTEFDSEILKCWRAVLTTKK